MTQDLITGWQTILSLQVVEVLEGEEGGWWRVRFEDSVGLFPSNYVEVLAPPPDSTHQLQTPLLDSDHERTTFLTLGIYLSVAYTLNYISFL